jgi:RNA polymerase sigma factor (sigma-70 family)
MAKGRLGVVVHYLRGPFHTRVAQDATDADLLERFLTMRNEAAFSALVQRHAGMVLSVARRVLHDRQDAEDVFQATFLVLARKGSSIRQRRALAGWLYQIAHHLALKAKANNARRRACERRAEMMPQAASDTRLHSDELRAVLDQELSRLPENYRSPLVLHYLEGKTKKETARELGWTEGTVSGRLDRARTLLRSRLIRRGFVLPTAAVTMILAKNTTVAAVSPLLVSATVNAAVAYAWNVTAGCAVSASATCLAEDMLKELFLAKIKPLTIALVTLSFLVAGAGAYQALGAIAGADLPWQNSGENGHTTQTKSENAQVHATVDLPSEAESKYSPLRLSASGQVTDDKGKPIRRATVYLREMALLRDSADLEDKAYTDILAQTQTDANGRFVLKDVPARPMKISPSNIFRHPWSIVVTAKGHGVAWHVLKSTIEEDLALIMPPEARLRGRLLDRNNKPAVGVAVQVREINDQLDPDIRNRVLSMERLELYWSRLPLAAVTDVDGRFVVEGLPSESHIGLLINSPRFARKWLNCATTIAKSEIDRLNDKGSVPPESKLLPDGFTVTLQPSGSVRGQVFYGDTGEPARGTQVTIGIYGVRTDAQGRYSFEQFETNRQFTIYVKPREETDYLPNLAKTEIPGDTLVQRQNFTLERGSVITGNLREKETGRPLAVPYVDVFFASEERKDIYPRARSKPDGSFRIVVPPGKGKLSTHDSVPGCVPRELMGEFVASTTDSEPIEIRSGETLAGKDLFFARGMVVQGRVLDTEGKPVAGAVFHGITQQQPSGTDGSFTLRGLSPAYKSHFLVLHTRRRLGARITITPRSDPKPVSMDVHLQATQSASARVIDENRQPLANAQVSLLTNIRMVETEKSFSYRPLPVYGPVRTDAAGRFTLPGFVINGSYTVKASARGYAEVENHFRVEAGKNPDVHDLMLLTNELTLGGVVVDPAGNPVGGIEVWIQPRNQTVARDTRSLTTEKDGQFRFDGLTRGTYRLMATLWKPTGEIGKDGRPMHKAEARTQLQIEAGQKNLRIVLEQQ